MTGSRITAAFAAVFGVLAVASLPVAAAASRFISGITLLSSLYVAVPVTLVLGLSALLLARRARTLQARSVFGRGGGLARGARWLAWAGLYLGVTGGIALAVYGALRWAG
jgi:hypothetical protein